MALRREMLATFEQDAINAESQNIQPREDQARATYASVTRPKDAAEKKPTELAPICVKEDEQQKRKEVEELMKLKTLDSKQESILIKQIESLVLENKVLRDSNRRLVEQYDTTHGKVSEIDILTTLDSDRAPVRYPLGDVRSIHLAKHAMREEEHYKKLKLAKLKKMFDTYDGAAPAAMARRKMIHQQMASRYPSQLYSTRKEADWNALRLRARPFVPRSSLYRRY